MKIKEVLGKGEGVSFEFSPPRTPEAETALFENLKALETIEPAYVSVTYGAGGRSRENTKGAVLRMAQEEKLNVMAHLTCIGHSKQEVVELVDVYKDAGIENIMALRGDKPIDMELKQGDFPHAVDLVKFLRERYGEHFSIGCAAFPELHHESKTLTDEIRYLKEKLDAGTDFAVSQLFFFNEFFYRFIDAAMKAKIERPIVPGIMPITNLKQIQKMAELSGAKMPQTVVEKMEKVIDKDDEMEKIGVEFAVKQCEDLMKNGFRFLHFFTLNKSHATMDIVRTLRGGK